LQHEQECCARAALAKAHSDNRSRQRV
jgi:hypothetical protein